MPLPATCDTVAKSQLCNYDQFLSHSIQESLEIQLLYKLLVGLDGTQAGKTWAQLLTDAGAFKCRSTAGNKRIQANLIFSGLSTFNPAPGVETLHCYAPKDREAIKTGLICKLVSALNT